MKMKNIIPTWAILALSAVSGCTQGTPGGPGASDTAINKPGFGQADDTFNLTVPVMATSLQQGEKLEMTIGIKRAKNFGADVDLKFSDLPVGVTVDPTAPSIKHGDTDAKIRFAADDDAVVGEFKVKIAGHPTLGSDAHVDFKLTIAAKDSFTLIPPRQSTTLKQGETKTISIGIKRDKTFNQDIALDFGDLPTGVIRDPQSPVIKHGETETQITLTSADDAALGNFAIKLIGRPAQGANATTEFKLTVIKP